MILLTVFLSAKTVKILEVPSEIGAGTRGASLASRAIEIAAINANSNYFQIHPVETIEPENNALYLNQKTPHAKNIEALSNVIDRMTLPVFRAMKDKKTFLIVIAGDHSTAAGTLAGMKKAYLKQRIGVIWIDAHANIHTPYTSPTGNLNGMPVAIALGEDNYLKKKNKPDELTVSLWDGVKELGGPNRNIQPSDIIYIAVRDTQPEEDFLMRKYSIKNYPVDAIRRRGVEEVVTEALRRLRHCDVIYLSFDVDSMDSSISSGTGDPAANGLTKEEAEGLLVGLSASPKVRCLEIAEINPLLDENNTMADIAFQLINAVTKEVEK